MVGGGNDWGHEQLIKRGLAWILIESRKCSLVK